MVALQRSQSVQKIGIFSPCFLFLRIFRSALLNNLCLHALQDIDVSFLCEYSDSHCFTINTCTHCNKTYNMFIFWEFLRTGFFKTFHTISNKSMFLFCEYSDSHCFSIYVCTHCNKTYNIYHFL